MHLWICFWCLLQVALIAGEICEDTSPECRVQGHAICLKIPNDFAKSYCRLMCEFCDFLTNTTIDEGNESITTNAVTSTAVPDAICDDLSSVCRQLGHAICKPPFLDFAKVNCRLFCELCDLIETPTNTTAKPAQATLLNQDCNKTAEVVFVIDSSSSVGEENFQKIREFTQNVTIRLKTEYEKLNVTVITFSNDAKVVLMLNESTPLSMLIVAESNIIFTHGGTQTHKALELMFNSFNHDVNNAKIAIVITDGASFEPDQTRVQAENAKKNGVTIFVVGVGDDVNTHETRDISSDPDSKFLFQLSDFGALSEIVNEFHSSNCPGKYTNGASKYTTQSEGTEETTVVTELSKTSEKVIVTTQSTIPNQSFTSSTKPPPTPISNQTPTLAPGQISTGTSTDMPPVLTAEIVSPVVQTTLIHTETSRTKETISILWPSGQVNTGTLTVTPPVQTTELVSPVVQTTEQQIVNTERITTETYRPDESVTLITVTDAVTARTGYPVIETEQTSTSAKVSVTEQSIYPTEIHITDNTITETEMPFTKSTTELITNTETTAYREITTTQPSIAETESKITESKTQASTDRMTTTTAETTIERETTTTQSFTLVTESQSTESKTEANTHSDIMTTTINTETITDIDKAKTLLTVTYYLTTESETQTSTNTDRMTTTTELKVTEIDLTATTAELVTSTYSPVTVTRIAINTEQEITENKPIITLNEETMATEPITSTTEQITTHVPTSATSEKTAQTTQSEASIELFTTTSESSTETNTQIHKTFTPPIEHATSVTQYDHTTTASVQKTTTIAIEETTVDIGPYTLKPTTGEQQTTTSAFAEHATSELTTGEHLTITGVVVASSTLLPMTTSELSMTTEQKTKETESTSLPEMTITSHKYTQSAHERITTTEINLTNGEHSSTVEIQASSSTETTTIEPIRTSAFEETTVSETNIPTEIENTVAKTTTKSLATIFTENTASTTIQQSPSEYVTTPVQESTTSEIEVTIGHHSQNSTESEQLTIGTITKEVIATTTSEHLTITNAETTPPIALSTTTASCVAKVADVVFVVDASGSIGPANFQKVKAFIKDVIQTFDIDPRHTRVALIEFSTFAKIEFKLNEITNLTELLEAVENITYSGGGTSTSDALELMRLEGFDRERPDAPDVAIVITDGLSKYPQLTRVQAELAKKDEITIFSIGIGNETDQTELMAIASSARYLFEVGDYDTLITLDNVVAHRACGVDLPEEHHTRSTTTQAMTPSGCADLSPDCSSYPRDSCTDYEPYARKNCAQTCGYCPGHPLVAPICEDKIGNCNQYGSSMCFTASQYSWVDSNCRKYCGFCGNKTDVIATTTQSAVMTTESSCTDKEQNCTLYGADICSNAAYTPWVKGHCAKHCGYCYLYHSIPSTVVNTIKCPAWRLPVQCTMQHTHGQCCPLPKCPSGYRLTIKRHLL